MCRLSGNHAMATSKLGLGPSAWGYWDLGSFDLAPALVHPSYAGARHGRRRAAATLRRVDTHLLSGGIAFERQRVDTAGRVSSRGPPFARPGLSERATARPSAGNRHRPQAAARNAGMRSPADRASRWRSPYTDAATAIVRSLNEEVPGGPPVNRAHARLALRLRRDFDLALENAKAASGRPELLEGQLMRRSLLVAGHTDEPRDGLAARGAAHGSRQLSAPSSCCLQASPATRRRGSTRFSPRAPACPRLTVRSRSWR
jgi:hypothetical protein